MHEARKGLLGCPDAHDRLWLIHTPEGVFGLSEYNWEITGFDRGLADLDESIRYSGNAYYVTGALAGKRGWKVEHIEDRP